ncbi:surfeit locus protein 6-domain-containing protein [Pseudoneurospora amorphoporcata]|uniref:Surfeit locus protein 6-domain-containing protein n=1 Tax=Pseudoneurospora amorphoporcata TaxID=241081 RepID=A0AAN6SHJ9_9PEZI|nr:surfeit locus protein 6-domain-containing protein [Pseudoneurospora amorphoporcata]
MADTDLQERLRSHAQAFDGLLSLIPAKMYYGEDNSDQWKKKKQTKEQAKAAKRGKLDPDSELNRNAKEVMEERARNKRKLQEIEESSTEDSDIDLEIPGVEKEKPLEGLKKKIVKEDAENGESVSKKQKLSEEDDEAAPAAEEVADETPAEKPLSKKAQEKEAKRLAKLAKQEKKKAKLEAKLGKGGKTEKKDGTSEEVKLSTEADEDDENDDMAPIDVSGLVTKEHEPESQESAQSSVFDSRDKTGSAEPASANTSISSAIPPSDKPKFKLPADTTVLRERLAKKIEQLRAARKVEKDDEGKPIRTRQELIEMRREKEAKRKAHKREQRQKQREEEDRKRSEAIASSRNSPLSMLSPKDDVETNFAFSRLGFSDGVQLSRDAAFVKSDGAKKKGPLDPKSKLAKLEAQKKRLETLPEDKRKEILEKETWLAARKRAEGEKVHDDEHLLKKAVKRKEKAKSKSANEWRERKEGVAKAQYDRSKKREDNIQKKQDERKARKMGIKVKSGKGAPKGGKGGGKGASKGKSRPGFEGGFGGKKK